MRFSKDHEWVKIEGDVVTVGITAFAADALGDVVFVELPVLGAVVKAGDGFAVVESVKAASDVYAPVDGEVVDVNEALSTSPEIVNTDAIGGAWFAKIKISDASQLEGLMDQAAYDAFLATQ